MGLLHSPEESVWPPQSSLSCGNLQHSLPHLLKLLATAPGSPGSPGGIQSEGQARRVGLVTVNPLPLSPLSGPPGEAHPPVEVRSLRASRVLPASAGSTRVTTTQTGAAAAHCSQGTLCPVVSFPSAWRLSWAGTGPGCSHHPEFPLLCLLLHSRALCPPLDLHPNAPSSREPSPASPPQRIPNLIPLNGRVTIITVPALSSPGMGHAGWQGYSRTERGQVGAVEASTPRSPSPWLSDLGCVIRLPGALVYLSPKCK